MIGEICGHNITGWDPSVCKSNQLHVDMLRFSFIKLRYIPYIPPKWSVIFLQSWTSVAYFSNSTGSFVTNCQTMSMFDKFHLTFNFKSKASRDVFKNKSERQLTSTFYSKMSPQYCLHNILGKLIFWIISFAILICNKKKLSTKHK